MRHILTLLLCFTVISSNFGQGVVKTELPAWATFSDRQVESTVNKYDLTNGFYYTSYDQISHYSSKSYFIRYKVNIVNSSAIDYFSQLNIQTDTSFQQVNFHVFKIHRDGEIIDRLDDLELKLINDESSLDQNIISGTMMVNGILTDIRKNDEVEIAYSIVGENPIYEGQYHDVNFLQAFNHIDILNTKFIGPIGEKFYINIFDESTVDYKVYEEGNSVIHEVTGINVSSPELEESMSFSSHPFNAMETTTSKNWAAVKHWGQSIFEKETSQELDDLYNKLYEPSKSKLENATKILDHVQNSIRYISLNGGIGSILPTKPSEVIKRNFGDCKDKSLLLIHLLDKLGAEYAYAALVSSSSGKGLKKYIGGPILFDHVVVKAKIDGKVIWVDPTSSLQGGTFANRHSYNFGYALVVDQEDTGLEMMNTAGDKSDIEIIEEFDFSDMKGDATLIVTTILKGKMADYSRNVLDILSLKELEKQSKEVYSKIFLDVKTDKRMTVEDDYENNVIQLVESYIIGTPWQEKHNGEFKGYLLTFLCSAY